MNSAIRGFIIVAAFATFLVEDAKAHSEGMLNRDATGIKYRRNYLSNYLMYGTILNVENYKHYFTYFVIIEFLCRLY